MKIGEALAAARAHLAAGRTAEAQSIARVVLQAAPDSAAAYELLGLAAYLAGRGAEAVALLGQAAALAPREASYPDAVSAIEIGAGRAEEAERAARAALAIDPARFSAWINLAAALQLQGRYEESVAASRRATELAPADARAWSNLGAALQELHLLNEAVAALRHAIALDPSSALSHFNLATALDAMEFYVDAEAEFRKTLTLAPTHSGAWNNLALNLQNQNRLCEAESLFREFLRREPHSAQARENLAGVLYRQGRVEEAHAEYQQAIAAGAGPAAHSNDLYCRLFLSTDLADLAAAHDQWDRRYAAGLAARATRRAQAADPAKRLRLGFISPDFSKHPVGRLILRALEALDRAQCEVFCYMTSVYRDVYTERFEATADVWRRGGWLSPDALAEQVRHDRIDILFDLSGHTNDNRLLVFARKPAPIQIAWAGYPSTTGLRAMDYLLADEHQVPPGTDPFYRERILRLPESCVTFEPPVDGPAVGPLPARSAGHVTLGSTNNPAKISPATVAAWAEILGRVPAARLLLAYSSLDDPGVQRQLAARFAAQGVDTTRLVWAPGALFPAFLAVYNRIDLLLDTFPYSGGVTTCEALWMGVPVVTFPGPTYASRHSFGHLHAVGLSEFVAADRDGYVEVAVRMAAGLDHLERLRAGLRRRLETSPLGDGRRLADSLLQKLREIWHEYCASQRSGTTP